MPRPALVVSAAVAVALSVWVYRSIDTSGGPPLVHSFDLPPGAARFDTLEGFDFGAAVDRLAQSLRVKTVSRVAGVVSHPEGFLRLHELFASWFPAVHREGVEIVGEYSLLFHVRGADEALEPALLMSHMDVVPVPDSDLDRWDREPFAGHVVRDELEGRSYLYGRGTMDDKMGVLSILEAAEWLLSRGFRPRRGLYLFFGHDEEVGGAGGAVRAAALLRSRGVRLFAAVDEGGLIGDHLFPGVDADVGMIGVAEKGYVDIELSVRNEGGHSSSPPLPPTAAGRLARALTRVEGNQMPANLDIMRESVRALGPLAPAGFRFAFANLPLTRPLVERSLTSSRTVASSVRTTLVPTMLEGSEKPNVLPTEARAVVNSRIMYPDTVESVLEHVRRVIDDPAVDVRVNRALAENPSPVSPMSGDAYTRVAAAASILRPGGLPVIPIMCPGMTDVRHFAPLTSNGVFRFIPFVATPDDLQRFHGLNERVSLDDAANSVRFFHRLILNMCA